MEIIYKIHARKVVLSYLYQYYFFSSLEENNQLITDSLYFDNVLPKDEDFAEHYKNFQKSIHAHLGNEDEDIIYMLEHNYPWWQESIDMDYVRTMIREFRSYISDVEKKVNTYVTTFSFAQMDVLDKALFTLGYVEFVLFKTPKEILINELVELSKRYADIGSSKLVNAIIHKILSE